MRKTIFLSFIFAAFLNCMNAQNISAEKCASDFLHQKLIVENPDFIAKSIVSEQKIKNHLARKKYSKTTEKTYIIPLVFHIIHKGEAIGVGSNISDAQIISGINQLNAAYSNQSGKSIDTKIQFALAKLDTNCSLSTGIVRVNGSVLIDYASKGVRLETGNGAKEIDVKNLSRWPNSDYYNIWIVTEFDDNNGGDGIQGFAYFPNASATIDGAMIMNASWGSTGTVKANSNLGSTAIHEIGHALNLYHTFEGDLKGASCPKDGCGFDFGDCCDDTSPHIRAVSQCLNGSSNSCTGNIYDNVIHNYMDYSGQDCQYLFTQNQKDRMRAALEIERPGLLTSKALWDNVSFSSATPASCIPTTSAKGLSDYFLGIINVQFNNLHSTSGYAIEDGGYLDMTGKCLKSADVDKDSVYVLSIKVGSNINHVKAWIDYNNDGNFTDGDELVLNKNLDSAQTGTASVTIPSTAKMDTYLRMRVMNEFGINSLSSACLNPQYGQAEDYLVLVRSSPVYIEEIPTASTNLHLLNVGPNPFEDFVSLSFREPSNTSCSYSVVDLSGALVQTGVIPSRASSHQINTEHLKAGAYILQLQHANEFRSIKILKIN